MSSVHGSRLAPNAPIQPSVSNTLHASPCSGPWKRPSTRSVPAVPAAKRPSASGMSSHSGGPISQPCTLIAAPTRDRERSATVSVAVPACCSNVAVESASATPSQTPRPDPEGFAPYTPPDVLRCRRQGGKARHKQDGSGRQESHWGNPAPPKGALNPHQAITSHALSLTSKLKPGIRPANGKVGSADVRHFFAEGDPPGEAVGAGVLLLRPLSHVGDQRRVRRVVAAATPVGVAAASTRSFLAPRRQASMEEPRHAQAGTSTLTPAGLAGWGLEFTRGVVRCDRK